MGLQEKFEAANATKFMEPWFPKVLDLETKVGLAGKDTQAPRSQDVKVLSCHVSQVSKVQ